MLYEPQSASKMFLYRSQLQYEAKIEVFAQVIADRNRDVKGSDVDDEINDEKGSAWRVFERPNGQCDDCLANWVGCRRSYG